ncbi:Glycoside hydrolase, family 25 subgroup [Fusarium oxysporum f. sp. vasinfectum]|nr:Glycoside hydrolase, family 25 subgroup [Fusarium oxysporum f. sp. vasinfectum]
MYGVDQIVVPSPAVTGFLKHLSPDVTRPGLLQELTATVQGFDISHYQTNVDFQAAYNSGARFVIVKATEGGTLVDPKFYDHTSNAINVGFVHGAYHFAHPASSSGSVQADIFLANGGAWIADGMTLPGMLDLENNPSGIYVSRTGRMAQSDFYQTDQ